MLSLIIVGPCSSTLYQCLFVSILICWICRSSWCFVMFFFQLKDSKSRVKFGLTQEAVYNAFKLSYMEGDKEGRLIWPPPPWNWSEDGEHDEEIKLMPLADMEKIRTECGIQDPFVFVIFTLCIYHYNVSLCIIKFWNNMEIFMFEYIMYRCICMICAYYIYYVCAHVWCIYTQYTVVFIVCGYVLSILVVKPHWALCVIRILDSEHLWQDDRPANVWFQAVLQSMVSVLGRRMWCLFPAPVCFGGQYMSVHVGMAINPSCSGPRFSWSLCHSLPSSSRKGDVVWVLARIHTHTNTKKRYAWICMGCQHHDCIYCRRWSWP